MIYSILTTLDHRPGLRNYIDQSSYSEHSEQASNERHHGHGHHAEIYLGHGTKNVKPWFESINGIVRKLSKQENHHSPFF